MSNLTNNTSELRDILAAVNALPEAGGSGGITPSGTKEIEENGKYDVTNYAAVNVRVPSEEPVLQEGSATPTKSQQTVEPPSGVDGFSTFVVEKIPDEYVVPAGGIEINENGIHTVSGYAHVLVDVPDTPAVVRPLEITENGTRRAADEGLDGYSVVTVNVPSEEPVTEELTVDTNGTYEPRDGVDGFSKVTVNVVSGGGSVAVETCTVTVTNNALAFWYTNAAGNYIENTIFDADNTFNVQKNTILIAKSTEEHLDLVPIVGGGATKLLTDKAKTLAAIVTDDCTIAAW